MLYSGNRLSLWKRVKTKTNSSTISVNLK